MAHTSFQAYLAHQVAFPSLDRGVHQTYHHHKLPQTNMNSYRAQSANAPTVQPHQTMDFTTSAQSHGPPTNMLRLQGVGLSGSELYVDQGVHEPVRPLSDFVVHQDGFAAHPRPWNLLAFQQPPTFRNPLNLHAESSFASSAEVVSPSGYHGIEVNSTEYRAVSDEEWIMAMGPSPASPASTYPFGPLTPDNESTGYFVIQDQGHGLPEDFTTGEKSPTAVAAAHPNAIWPGSYYFGTETVNTAFQNTFNDHNLDVLAAANLYNATSITADGRFVNPFAVQRRADDLPSEEPSELALDSNFDETSASLEPTGVSDALEYDDVSQRQKRDDILLRERKNGLQYTEIKKRYGFREAESTLRGRFRVLSKPQNERVRKPEWRTADQSLLRRAIASETTGDRGASLPLVGGRPKIPWKKVANQITRDGASYPFGPSTCAKMWKQMPESNE